MLNMRFPEGRARAVTLSYDDGVEQDRQLMQILDNSGLRCTFNLNTGCFPPEGHTWPQGQIHRRMPESSVKALYQGGVHEVAVHTLTHPDLTQLPPVAMVKEIYEDRLNLEKLFGCIVRGAAYPYGAYSDATVEALRSCGIVYCRTVEATRNFFMPQDWLRLKATCHHGDPALEDLCDRFLREDKPVGPRLFYMWGHAYEFEANDNWQVIERFAGRMGGHEEIWYATNIAIHDYAHAWGELQVNAAGTAAYNPTAQTLWAQADQNRVIRLPAGEVTPLK